MMKFSSVRNLNSVLMQRMGKPGVFEVRCTLGFTKKLVGRHIVTSAARVLIATLYQLKRPRESLIKLLHAAIDQVDQGDQVESVNRMEISSL